MNLLALAFAVSDLGDWSRILKAYPTTCFYSTISGKRKLDDAACVFLKLSRDSYISSF